VFVWVVRASVGYECGMFDSDNYLFWRFVFKYVYYVSWINSVVPLLPLSDILFPKYITARFFMKK